MSPSRLARLYLATQASRDIFKEATTLSYPRRVDSKRGKVFCAHERAKFSRSMMNAGAHPKGMKTTTSATDSRTRRLLSKYWNNQDAKFGLRK